MDKGNPIFKLTLVLITILNFSCKTSEHICKSQLPLNVKINDEDYLIYDSGWSSNPAMKINHQWEKHNFDISKLHRKNYRYTYDDPNYKILHGIDVSRHEKKVNFKKVKKDGFDFVILRIAYRRYGNTGLLVKDEKFDEFFADAKAAGLKVGVYIFSQALNDEEALEEAQFIIDNLKPEDLDLPVSYDPELIGVEPARTDNLPPEVWTRNALLFCEKIREAGFNPMIYSNIYFEHVYFDLKQFQDANIPIWYADYSEFPQTPYNFAFWQYSDRGKVKGIKRFNVDHNLWFIPL